VNTLFLTAEEQKTFGALPAKLRDGWTVTPAVIVPEDPEELIVRRGMASFANAELRSACERLAETKDSKWEQVLSSLREQAFTREELSEMFFALGVEALNRFIAVVLPSAKTDEDVEFLSALTQVRSMLSEVNGSPA